MSSAGASAAQLTLEDRVACQTAIDAVRWSQMTWPETNPGPKPPLSDVLSADAIRVKVVDQLRMGAALESLYGERIDAAALQTELDRMANGSRAPEQLRAIHAALGNDADRIGECLARPILVQRRLRARYMRDPALHAALRKEAELALTRKPAAAIGHVVRYVRDDGTFVDDDPDAVEDPVTIPLSPEEWSARTAHSGDRHGNATPGPLRETDDAFVHETELVRRAEILDVRVQIWPKRSFDTWWQSEAVRWPTAVPVAAEGLRLAPVTGVGVRDIAKFNPGDVMPDDTWRVETRGPDARAGHSAIWTGTEMIVWGGRNGADEVLNSGGRYNLATATWRPMTLVSAPNARWGHTVVWTGDAMLVWGGVDANGQRLGTGAAYDPAADKWTALPLQGAPTPRNGHTAVWTGDVMIVWGGYTNQGATSKGARYAPGEESWQATNPVGAPAARSNHTAVWSDKGMIVWGGMLDDQVTTDTGSILRLDNQWIPVAPTNPQSTPSPRARHSAVWTGHCLYIWGGIETTQSSSVVASGGKLCSYNNAPFYWVVIPESNAPAARFGHSAIWTGDRMLIWGGSSPFGADGWASLGLGEFASEWTTLPDPLTDDRSGDTAIWAPDAKQMIVWGGRIDGDITDTGDTYDLDAQAWSPMAVAHPDLPSPRNSHTAVWTGTEMIVWGGVNETGRLNSGGRYDLATGTWIPTSTTGKVPSPRNLHTAVWTGSEMIVWGGADENATSIVGGARYNPLTGNAGTWVETISYGAAVYAHDAVWAGDRMVTWGGNNTTFGWLSTGIVLIPGQGNSASTATVFAAPDGVARRDSSMVWAPELQDVIVWGGRDASDSTVLKSGWHFDPSSSKFQLVDPDNVYPRHDHTAVWTGHEMVVWGGFEPGGLLTPLGSIYTPSTQAWKATSQNLHPGARAGHSALWTGKEMLIWGGSSGGIYLKSGGRFDPSAEPAEAWRPITQAGSPSARYLHAAVWAKERGEMLVWGGFAGVRLDSLGVYSAKYAPVINYCVVNVPCPIFSDSFDE